MVACMSVLRVYTVLKQPEEKIGSPGAGVNKRL